jgi:putative thioredoxin
LLLAQILAFRDPKRAVELASVSVFAGPGYIQIEEAVKTIARLLGAEGDSDDLPEGEGREAYMAAIETMQAGNFDTALEQFIGVIQSDRYYDDDGARKACVALFTLLGNEHPAVKKYRRRFDMALY